MGKGHVATTHTTRVDLSDGDWIEVKDELSMADVRTLDQAAAGGGVALAIATAVAWIHAWSLCDASDRQMPVSEGTVSSLSTRTFDRLQTALLPHIQKARMGQEKNAPSDPPAPDQTSPSVG
jgi:hypothetical protein